MLKYPAFFSIDFVFSAIEVAFSTAAAPFACASMPGAQNNVATAAPTPTAFRNPKRFDISAASRTALFKLAEVFYIKSISAAAKSPLHSYGARLVHRQVRRNSRLP